MLYQWHRSTQMILHRTPQDWISTCDNNFPSETRQNRRRNTCSNIRFIIKTYFFWFGFGHFSESVITSRTERKISSINISCAMRRGKRNPNILVKWRHNEFNIHWKTREWVNKHTCWTWSRKIETFRRLSLKIEDNCLKSVYSHFFLKLIIVKCRRFWIWFCFEEEKNLTSVCV